MRIRREGKENCLGSVHTMEDGSNLLVVCFGKKRVCRFSGKKGSAARRGAHEKNVHRKLFPTSHQQTQIQPFGILFVLSNESDPGPAHLSKHVRTRRRIRYAVTGEHFTGERHS